MKTLALALTVFAAGLAGCSGSGAALTPPVAPTAVTPAAAVIARDTTDVNGGISFTADISDGGVGTLASGRVANPWAIAPSAIPLSGQVTGRVYKNHKPYAGGTVALVREHGSRYAYAVTSDDQGRFMFAWVAADEYALAVDGTVLPAGAVRLHVAP